MKVKILAFILCALVFFQVAGCSLMSNSYPQPIFIDTGDKKQVRAEIVTSSRRYRVVLPTVIEEKSTHSGISIRVLDSCYEQAKYKIPRVFDSSFYWNIAAFIYVGFIVDLPFGRYWDYGERVTISPTRRSTCG